MLPGSAWTKAGRIAKFLAASPGSSNPKKLRVSKNKENTGSSPTSFKRETTARAQNVESLS
jgi:hypothetical protein